MVSIEEFEKLIRIIKDCEKEECKMSSAVEAIFDKDTSVMLWRYSEYCKKMFYTVCQSFFEREEDCVDFCDWVLIDVWDTFEKGNTTEVGLKIGEVDSNVLASCGIDANLKDGFYANFELKDWSDVFLFMIKKYDRLKFTRITEEPKTTYLDAGKLKEYFPFV